METLTHLVGTIESPCVFSIDAEWGFGKTTFLNIWKQNLLNQKFPVIWFNAWENDLSEIPFMTVITELNEEFSKYEQYLAASKIMKFQSAATKVAHQILPGFIRAATSLIPFAGTMVAEEIASMAEEKLKPKLEARREIIEFREILRSMVADLSEAHENRPLIVMIDELDRCRPSYAVEFLEVAKHLFSVNNIVFVLAINCRQLAHSVRALYGNGFDAEEYLRRFFDVDFRLPDPDRNAFIRLQLEVTGINEYFCPVPEEKEYGYQVYFPERVARPVAGERLKEMLLSFFGASEFSLRTVGQSIRRLGLVFASLDDDQSDYGWATGVAIILRTIDADLYHRFAVGEASDLEVADAIFNRPSLRRLRHQQVGAIFEAALILAAAEEEIPKLYPSQPLNSPLMNQHQNRERTDREVFGSNEHSPLSHEDEHAKRVIDLVEQTINSVTLKEQQIGFKKAVRRLELFDTELISASPETNP
ncbi:KAP family P-loop NTPase fold protein [Hoeflea sp.]|uniref:KAP family P-loop NTPase fold protein n=1 Tax=Hoeflea sp. TaxID=1940281 RepID=UPI003B010DB5